MLRIGIDDTDSPRGGCTTHLLTELIALARAEGVDLVGEPRLVRLNPNVPWKTRGNAALSARFGRGVGRTTRLGAIDGRPVRSYARGAPLPRGVRDRFLERAWSAVLAGARVDDPGTDPALVAVDRPLPASLYWAAVRSLVPIATARRVLDDGGAFYRTHGSERGLVGAAAAVAWPGGHPTWELIAYRRPSRVGAPRRVDPASVREVERAHPALFLCDDPRTRRLLVAPHTDCPILYGLRSVDPDAVRRARAGVRSEPVDRWVVFRTNQGSGDHLVPRSALGIGPYESAIVDGSVADWPATGPGGHVRFDLTDATGGLLACLAFEPTKTLPAVARTLVPGDRLRVWGSRTEGGALALEGIRIVRAVAERGPLLRPRCPTCDRATGSLGRGRGYRCPRCRARWPPESAVRARALPAYPRGVYHPTPSARRHLHPRGPEPGRPPGTRAFEVSSGIIDR